MGGDVGESRNNVRGKAGAEEWLSSVASARSLSALSSQIGRATTQQDRGTSVSETHEGNSPDGRQHPPPSQLPAPDQPPRTPYPAATGGQELSRESEAETARPRPRCSWSGVLGKARSLWRRRVPSDQPRLKSLAPQYDEAQHKTYLDHLEAAVTDPRNRNIAVSGRYGTGKSSVLVKFQEKHKDSTLRLAISTLAPDAQGVTLTNRIQKEVLKQLVYSAGARTLRHSRFSQRGPLSRWRAFGESALFVGVFGVLLALLRLLPSQVADGADHSLLERIAVWGVVGVLLAGVLAVVRMVTYNRYVVSGMSAAGATLSLSTPENTYFDEHLDEIVYFFDQEPVDFVIFEDLDRYNDPQIFQALRELNTLLNNTPKRLREIEKHKNSLRFIYAMRDSLFQAIGEDTAEQVGDDVARAENILANRTKFFEVVIPVVPFISHRTAREHLHHLLQGAGIASIDRSLVELVAKHVTDMRLLLNIRNEYVVFAERLLESDKVAPELAPSQLFALVAYKNFHLEDFENISRRGSDLDRLYDFHRRLVAGSVANREQHKRDLLARNAAPPAISGLANRLGRRLVALGHATRDQQPNRMAMHLGFTVNSKQYDQAAVTRPDFWEAVVESRTVAVQVSPQPYLGPQPLITLSQRHLEGLFPEALAGRWEERNADAAQREVKRLDGEIESLRGVDFQDVINDTTLTMPAAGEDRTDEGQGMTFRQFVDTTLKSDLARDLVAQGYIDQNFTLYAAQFYGDFTGVDVATFIVQTVQTNNMEFNYSFTGPEAIANLLAETDANFTSTISAYNIQVLDYLLVNDLERADEVVRHITTKFGADASKFVAAYFTANGQRARLASRMSRLVWENVFTHLSADAGVPADVRASLVDAALLAADPDGAYDLGPEFTEFVVAHYEEMGAFTEPQPMSELDALVTILRRAEVRLPSIEKIHEQLKSLLLKNNLYELTAGNLRAALGITGEVTLDRVRGNDAVYQYCLTDLDVYLDAVEGDDDTPYSVRTSETLVDVLNAVEDNELVKRLTNSASPKSSLPRLADALVPAWPELAAAKLIRATLGNLQVYRAEIGEIDKNFGQLLVSVGSIDTEAGDSEDVGAADKSSAAIAVLNARSGISFPEDRARLVRSLGLDEPLPTGEIAAEASNLFALLIEHELVNDDATTFAHLRAGGWAAVQPAIIASKKVGEFLSPDLIDGVIAPLFASAETSSKLGKRVLESLAQFVPADDGESLLAAAQFAVRTNQTMPVEHIRRIAAICRDPQLTVQLLAKAAPAASDVVAVLNELGGKYSYLSSWEQDEFEVPDDRAHKVLLTILQKAGVCKFTKKRGKPLYIVKQT
jgi:hypothetical protein